MGFVYYVSEFQFVNAVWREFLWGGIAGAFGEGMMHPIDTVKTRIQSQAIFSASQVRSCCMFVTNVSCVANVVSVIIFDLMDMAFF